MTFGDQIEQVHERPKDIKRGFDRRRLILEEAERYDRISRLGCLDGTLRDTYRDMAAALRLLADERGT